MILGFRNKDTFLVEDFRKYAEVIIATDDGSLGCRGTVIDAANEIKVAENTVLPTSSPVGLCLCLEG